MVSCYDHETPTSHRETARSRFLFPSFQCCCFSSRLAEFLSSCHTSSFVTFARSFCLCWIEIRCHIFVLLQSSALFLFTSIFVKYCVFTLPVPAHDLANCILLALSVLYLHFCCLLEKPLKSCSVFIHCSSSIQKPFGFYLFCI